MKFSSPAQEGNAEDVELREIPTAAANRLPLPPPIQLTSGGPDLVYEPTAQLQVSDPLPEAASEATQGQTQQAATAVRETKKGQGEVCATCTKAAGASLDNWVLRGVLHTQPLETKSTFLSTANQSWAMGSLVSKLAQIQKSF